MPKSSQKKGGAKKEYTGTYRHFTLHEVNGKEVDIGTATIKDHQTPLNAAKKLLSSWCRHQGIKSNERNKVNITFTIRETTRGHSKIYGPYKGKFVKYDKPVMIKLKNGKVIKRTVKPMVKLSKGNNNKKMMGGQSNGKILITEDDLRKLIEYIKISSNLKNRSGSLNNRNARARSIYTTYNLAQYGKDLSKLNVSGIKDMSNLFQNFNFSIVKQMQWNLDISEWNVNEVENMESMFANSKGFNQDLNRWNVYHVKNMKNMFLNCKDLYQSFSNWIIEKSTETDGMFSGCDKYKTYIGRSKILIKRTKGTTIPHSPDIESNSYWTSQQPYVSVNTYS